MTTVVRGRAGQAPQEQMERFRHIRVPVRSQYMCWNAQAAVGRFIQELVPDVVIDRYHSFAAAGSLAAAQLRLLSLPEVNASLMDPPGTPKTPADALLLRWIQRRELA